MPMTPQARRAPEHTASVQALRPETRAGRTSIAGGLASLALRAGLRVVALAQVVLQLVHDHGATDNRVGARQRDLRSSAVSAQRWRSTQARFMRACASVSVNSAVPVVRIGAKRGQRCELCVAPTSLCGSAPNAELRTLYAPSAAAVMLPRSPAWRSASVGAPCVLPAGLKWAPGGVACSGPGARELRSAITHRLTGGHAAVGGVAELVDVEAMQPSLQTSDLAAHGGGAWPRGSQVSQLASTQVAAHVRVGRGVQSGALGGRAHRCPPA